MPRIVTNEERLSVQIANDGVNDRIGATETETESTSDLRQAEPNSDTAPDTATSPLDDLAREIRLAARAGDRQAAAVALKQHNELANQLRQSRVGYNDIRHALAQNAMAMLQPDLASADVLRYVRPDAPRPLLRANAARLDKLAAQFSTVFQPGADWLAGRKDDSAIVQADLGIVADFRKLNPTGQQEADFHKSFFGPIEAAVRLGTQAGLRVVAIPAFIFPLLQQRPPHILSFHSAGLFPGFTHFKRADLPGYLSVDRGGYSGWSTLSEADLADLDLPPLDEATLICQRLWQDIVKENVSKYTQDPANDDLATLPDDYVFLPLQVPTDRTQAMARFTMDEMVQIAVSRFRGTGTAVVVKPHPKSLDLDQFGRLTAMAETGDIVLRFDGIHALIAGARAVITVNSGVGSEALLHRKPIYCFGGADYDAVAHRITSAEQFNALATPIHPAISDDDLTRFTAYYRTVFLVERDRRGRLDQAIMERVIRPALTRPKP